MTVRHGRNVPILWLILVLVVGAIPTHASVRGSTHGSEPKSLGPMTDSSSHSSGTDPVGFMPVRSLSTETSLDPQSTSCSPVLSSCGNLTYHNGPVMHSPGDFLIFWLPNGYNFDNSTIDPGASNPSNARYEQLISRYFTDICRPNSFYAIIQQYPDRSSNITSCFLGGSWVDTSNYPSGRGSHSNPLSDGDIRNEVTRAMSANGWTANSGNNEFFVFTGYSVCSYLSGCPGDNFCAYHSSFSGIIYANMPDAGTQGCGVGSTPNNDPFVDFEINISSHEQFEAFTNPTGGGWFYQDGAHEIGDECAWVFDSSGATLIVGSDSYRIQDEWSNNFGGCTSQGFGCAATALATDFLGCDGQGPTTIGLTWGQSGYGGFFNDYQVQESATGSNGPWATVGVISSITNTTEYVRDLSPNSTYWWRVVEVCCSGLATTTTNVLQVTQPSAAKLTYATLSQTSYKLSWTNNALYIGTIAFNGYVLWASINQNTYSVVANLTSEPNTNFTINTSPSNNYSFYLTTADECIRCSSQGLSSSDSNAVGIGGASSFVGGLFGEYWNASFFGSALTGCTAYNSPVTPSTPPNKTMTNSGVNFGTSTAWNWHPFGFGNEFSVKWIGGITIQRSGTYSFQLASDDGSWLYIDSALLVNHGGQHTLSDIPGNGSLFLNGGLHQIEIDYYETCGPPSGISVTWTPPGTPDAVLVPSNILVAPPRLDGQGVYPAGCAIHRTCQLLTTNNAQDVVVLLATCRGNCTGVTPSVTDSLGLTFNNRASYCYTGNTFGSCIWEYYAVATAPITGDNITSTPNKNVFWRMATLGLSGVDTNALFDPILPAGQHCAALNGSPADCTINFSISKASAPAPYEFLLVTSALNDADSCNSPPSQGWNYPIFFDSNLETDYQMAPLSQYNYSFTCTVRGDPLVILAEGVQGRSPDFTITENPSAIAVVAGAIGTSTITVTSLNGFSGRVNLASSAPSGLSCSMSTTSVLVNTTAASTILNCTGVAGNYSLAVTATGGNRTHTILATFQVTDFRISSQTDSLTILPGGNSTLILTLQAVNGFQGIVSLNPNVSPQGPISSLGSSSVLVLASGNYSLATVTVSSNIAPGNYTLTVQASYQTLVRTTSVIIRVPAPGSVAGSSVLSWEGYDWDGAGEVTLSLNGRFLASLPATDSQQNSGTWVSFSLNITSLVVQGVNTLTFIHANWDCATSDNVRNLQIMNGAIQIYSNFTVLPLGCTQSLTYSFPAGSPSPSVGGTVISVDKLRLVLPYILLASIPIVTFCIIILAKRKGAMVRSPQVSRNLFSTFTSNVQHIDLLTQLEFVRSCGTKPTTKPEDATSIR